MGRKLIASDFDGTIGWGDRLKKDLDAIARFRAEGNLFGLVSGRNIEGLKWVRDRAGMTVDFLLADSGGTCLLGDKLVFCEETGPDVFFPLVDFLMSRGTKLIACNRADGVDMLYYRHRDGREDYDPKRALWKARPFPQISGAFPDYQTCRAVADEMELIFPKLTPLPNDDCLDIVPKGRDKAVGIAQLADLLGVARENVFSVGDNYNDLAMLDAFNSFAVMNAPPDVQSHARCGVVPAVSDMIDLILGS